MATQKDTWVSSTVSSSAFVKETWRPCSICPLTWWQQFLTPDTCPFVTHHGIFTLEHLRQFATLTLAANNRDTQDNFMMGTAILASLSPTMSNRINIHRQLYTIGANISATLLLKVIIREAHLDSNASTRFARANLSNLDDIAKFNELVRQQLDILAARGETTLDLLPNLMKGYKAVSDQAFLQYIEDSETKYDNGEFNYMPEQFMHLCANRYKTCLEGGIWNSPNRDQSRILTLQAQVNQLQAGNRGTAAEAPRAVANRNGQPCTARRDKCKPEPWMLVKPANADVKNDVLKAEGCREYWWCVHHKRYCQHKTGDCKLGTGAATPPDAAPTTAPTEGSGNRALKVADALVAISSGNRE
jgi:hypothetical protein